MLAAVEPVLVPLGLRLSPWSVAPFVATLVSLAVFPVAAPRLWHAHFPKIVLAIALTFVLPFLALFGGEAAHELGHILLADYVSFLVIIIGLYAISGGMLVRGEIRGGPRTNTALLALGTLMASVAGTTGASMILIRPILNANAHRTRRAHIVVFFIFLVANIGGCLTPLGDPPLFLGFLAGVPFFWTLHLAPQLAVLATILLAVFYAIDRSLSRREGAAAAPARAPGARLRLDGKRNLALLAIVVGAVALSGFWHPGKASVLGIGLPVEGLVRDAIILGCALVSLLWTPRSLRADNAFGWEPVREVAIVFAGVFVTILPVLAILKTGPQGPFAPLFRVLDAPWQYFWATGVLSSFLDNAPSYLAMLGTQIETFHGDLAPRLGAAALSASHPRFLSAVSAAAVFMGGVTYIGNAPNFMVKTIAEQAGVEMPTFLGYIVRWSLPILGPVFVLLTILFFR
jgi:Na+/H+ antiporter NhaD/arsenite permease-like protein